ncbi:MAG: NUDIX domain-containing protein [Anaerolineae bacterium]|nr:NUDIX domain-containing protein [Anaerolineae bacterium]
MGAKEQGADATANRWLVIPRTLCFVLNQGKVLLMKRGSHKRVFPNRYNGVGGHIERDEDPYTSAQREILEETGLVVQNLKLCGVYNIDTGETTGIMLHIFTAVSDQHQVIQDSPEGTLHWVDPAMLDQLDLVEDLPLILPRVLAMSDQDAPFFVHVSYDQNDHIVMRFAE